MSKLILHTDVFKFALLTLNKNLSVNILHQKESKTCNSKRSLKILRLHQGHFLMCFLTLETTFKSTFLDNALNIKT